MYISDHCHKLRHEEESNEEAAKCALMITDFPSKFSNNLEPIPPFFAKKHNFSVFFAVKLGHCIKIITSLILDNEKFMFQ